MSQHVNTARAPWRRWRRLVQSSLLLIGILTGGWSRAEPPLQVVATLPDMGCLVRAIGAERVQLRVLARPSEDPHYVNPRPGFVKALHDADLYAENGLELEAAWAPVLVQRARNPRIQPGKPGHFVGSDAIVPRGAHRHGLDRRSGDVHAAGNPHYLLDPLNGLAVAKALSTRLGQLRPHDAAYFQHQYAQFAQALSERLLGPLASHYAPEQVHELADAQAQGRLSGILMERGQFHSLGGWLGDLRPYAGRPLVDDHDMWIYLTARFRWPVIGHMEPLPGILPTPRHLESLVAQMKAEQVRVIITAQYYDPRHADFVANASGARVARLAHLPGAAPGTDTYLDWMDHNLKSLRDAFAAP